MKDLLEWVGTGGGPLIVLPAELARHWRGGENVRFSLEDVDRWWEKTDLAGSDYGRACCINDGLGTLEVGPGEALILHDEPMPTTFISTSGGGILVRLSVAESEAEVRQAIRSIPESIWEPTPYQIQVGRKGIIIFDSAYPGDSLPSSCGDMANVPWLRVALPAGTYLVDTADYGPDESIRLILHRLRKGRSKSGPTNFLLITFFGEPCDSPRVRPKPAGSEAIRNDTASR